MGPLPKCGNHGTDRVAWAHLQEGEEGSGSVVLTWGRGREGQLGSGGHADSALPRAVEELRGRRVLQVSGPAANINPFSTASLWPQLTKELHANR
jgi:hypothetical protein